MKNFKIGTKISFGFSIVIFLMIICMAVVVVTNIITIQNLNNISTHSLFQTMGSDLSNAFYEARLYSKTMIYLNDDSYTNIVKYLAICDDIIGQMNNHIADKRFSSKLYTELGDVESKILAYGKEIDTLQKIKIALADIEKNVSDLGAILTELSTYLEELNNAILYETIFSDIPLSEKLQQLNNLTDSTKIVNGIWNIRYHASRMMQLGLGYDNYDYDLRYIDDIINLIQNSKSISENTSNIKTHIENYKTYVMQFRDETKLKNKVVENVVSAGTDSLNSLNLLIYNVDNEMTNQVARSVKTATMVLGTVLILAISSVIIAIIMANYIKHSIISIVSKSVHNISKISDAVVTSSRHLTDGSTQIAEGASEQAASIEETSATMNQTASMVKHTKENTVKAADLSEQSERHASESVQKVMNLMEIMNNLNVSSNEIRSIVETINTIAFQTNILALNAAVEAVKAGEVGRSFSVVAEEVRSLSQKSTAAATNTAEIIERNINLMEQGTTSAKEVSESLKGIFDNVQKVNVLLSEISVASEEQNHGVEQINKAIAQMEKVTQSSAAVAQQSSASANEMLDSSETLVSITSELAAMI